MPLRIALADHPFDADSNALLDDAAPWSARLAARLLREDAQGAASQWRPYLDVLPTAVDTPAQWPWERVCGIRYQPAADHLHEAHWAVESAVRALTPESIGQAEGDALTEADLDRFRCAHTKWAQCDISTSSSVSDVQRFISNTYMGRNSGAVALWGCVGEWRRCCMAWRRVQRAPHRCALRAACGAADGTATALRGA